MTQIGLKLSSLDAKQSSITQTAIFLIGMVEQAQYQYLNHVYLINPQMTQDFYEYEQQVKSLVLEQCTVTAKYIAKLWSEFIQKNSLKKKLPMVYIANDIIQRSL